MSILLTRVVRGEKGTFGVLSFNDIPICVTCENKPLPIGVYDCAKWKIEGTDVALVTGNDAHDAGENIAVGQGFFTYTGIPAISNSKATMNLLQSTLPEKFILTIKEAY